MTSNVAAFLRCAHADASLSNAVAAADSYSALSTLAIESGLVVTAVELKQAFRERNAKVLAAQMIRAGMVEEKQVPEVPVLDPARWNALLDLDLSPMMTQFVNRKGWSCERAATTAHRYRCFFYLMAHCSIPAVPTEQVDEFWHQHILNTQKYAMDCNRYGGRFFHHVPASGDDAEEAEQLNGLFFETWVAYETMFDIPYEETVGTALLNRWPNVASEKAA